MTAVVSVRYGTYGPYGKERVKTKQNQNLRPLALGHLVVPRTSMGRSIGLGCATSTLNHDCSCLSPLRDLWALWERARQNQTKPKPSAFGSGSLGCPSDIYGSVYRPRLCHLHCPPA